MNLQTYSDLHQVDFFGITILEPSTVLSSLMMTVVCVIGFCRSYRHRRFRIALLTLGFLGFMALATAFGGILGHGLLYTTGKVGKLPGWIFGIIALAFYERGVMYRLKDLLDENRLRHLLRLNLAGMGFFLLLTIYFLHFQVPQYHAIYSLLILVGSMEIYVYRQIRNRGSIYIFSAIGCAFMAALAHASGVHLSDWFQANDVSHIPMAGSIWLLYAGMANGNFQPVKITSELR